MLKKKENGLFPFKEIDPTSGRQVCGGKGSKDQGVGDAENVRGDENQKSVVVS